MVGNATNLDGISNASTKVNTLTQDDFKLKLPNCLLEKENYLLESNIKTPSLLPQTKLKNIFA